MSIPSPTDLSSHPSDDNSDILPTKRNNKRTLTANHYRNSASINKRARYQYHPTTQSQNEVIGDSEDSDLSNSTESTVPRSLIHNNASNDDNHNHNHNEPMVISRMSSDSESSANNEELNEVEGDQFEFNDSNRYRRYNQNVLEDKYNLNKRLCITKSVINMGDEQIPKDCVAAIQQQNVQGAEQKAEDEEKRFVIALAKPFNAHKLYVTGRKISDLFSFSMSSVLCNVMNFIIICPHRSN